MIIAVAVWGFFVLTSTLPPVWIDVGPFETLADCTAINRGMLISGAYIEVDPCMASVAEPTIFSMPPTQDDLTRP